MTDIEPLATSEAYRFSSHGNCHIAEIVFKHLLDGGHSPNEATWVSLQNIIGLALETCLKHFLSSRGFDEKKLRSQELRHNLDNLLKESEELGIERAGELVGQPGLSGALKKIVLQIGPTYGSHSYRYLKDGEFQVFRSRGPLEMIIQTIRCVLSLPT